MSDRTDAQSKAQLLTRLKTIQPADPLWVGLLWLVDANIEVESGALCQPNLGDEGAHRSRGRLSALRDLREQLGEAMQEAHQTE